jgi:uncharacterized protein (TIGR02246 family)
MVAANEPAREEAAIRQVLQRLVDGWNGQDSEIFSSAFCPTHDYVAINGQQMLQLTRDENAKLHAQVWAVFYREGSRISMEVTQVRQLAPGVALAHATSHNVFSTDGAPHEIDGSFTMVLTRNSDGQWLIDAFQNGKREEDFQGPTEGTLNSVQES